MQTDMFIRANFELIACYVNTFGRNDLFQNFAGIVFSIANQGNEKP